MHPTNVTSSRWLSKFTSNLDFEQGYKDNGTVLSMTFSRSYTMSLSVFLNVRRWTSSKMFISSYIQSQNPFTYSNSTYRNGTKNKWSSSSYISSLIKHNHDQTIYVMNLCQTREHHVTIPQLLHQQNSTY